LTMTDIYRVLIVDDDDRQSEMVSEFLRVNDSFQVDIAADLSSLWERLASNSYDIILLDYMLPDGTGLDALEGITGQGYQTPVVMVTGQGDERVAVQAIQHGATDYLIKGSNYLLTLPALIRRTVRAYQLQVSMQHSLEQIRYQATLLNNVRDSIVVWDMDSRINYWSPAAFSLFGWSSAERLGKPVAEVYLFMFNPPIVPPQPGDTIGHHIERQCRTKGNQPIWVSSRITALYDAERHLLGYMDVSHDITQRKEAEHALRAERNFVSAVLDTVGALVMVLDSSGKIVRFNRACEQITGYSLKEVRGEPVWDLFLLPEDAEPFKVLLKNVLEGQFPNKNENVWVTRHWEHHRIAWAYTALTNRLGQVEFVIATGIDVTEWRKAESEVRAAQTHLIQSARLSTLGELASGIAHQINNPLTTIIADAQLLLRQMPSNQPGHDSAEAIQQAGWRLQEVVQRLLEFSRPATATLETISINQSIDHALLLVGAHIQAAGVRLECQLDKKLPLIHGNARQLEDLWINLLLLARDATIDGKDHRIMISSQVGSENTVVVEVRDNGLPIPGDHLDSIFEPNFVGPAAGRGTGMELSICREIVRQHGGQITAQSDPDHDTIFRIMLPTEMFLNSWIHKVGN
jgi:PAS domain S-box-containing protein